MIIFKILSVLSLILGAVYLLIGDIQFATFMLVCALLLRNDEKGEA